MLRHRTWVCAILLVCTSMPAFAQQSTSAASAVVPTLVNFSGVLTDVNGKPLTGMVGVTFSLYKDSLGGAPLWVETQNVQPDKSGHYSVVLGSTSSQGLPANVFVSGEARWLGVQPHGQAEQPRVLLLSVPYALKAADAETVGGLPPSAFVLAAPPNSGSNGTSSGSNPNSSSNPNPPSVGGGGTTDYLPLWTSSTTLGNSVLFQSGTGAKAKVGIGTTKPASSLDVKGGGTIRGLFSLPASGTATATAGFNSQPMDLTASVFNSGTSTPVTQTFQWQAEPVGNDTSTATGSLNLLFGQGTNKPSETSLNIASNGLITFANGQTFPGTGDGTVTSVGLSAPGSDFTVSGSPVTTSGTLGLSWTVPPTNANTANAIVKRDGSGNFSASSVTATVVNTGSVIAPSLSSAGSLSLNAKTNGGYVIVPVTDSSGNATVNIIGGSNYNTVAASFGGQTIAGGGLFEFQNSTSNDYATVGGGENNTASGSGATVAGGLSNNASNGSATVGGGDSNTASGFLATVGGGDSNTASGGTAIVGGGSGNTASGNNATVGGGYSNTANGAYSTVPGGFANTASGVNSFAAGSDAHASADYSFMWCQQDGTICDNGALGANSFVVSVNGGIFFYDSQTARAASSLPVAAVGPARATALSKPKFVLLMCVRS